MNIDRNHVYGDGIRGVSEDIYDINFLVLRGYIFRSFL